MYLYKLEKNKINIDFDFFQKINYGNNASNVGQNDSVAIFSSGKGIKKRR
jgi:hypothetical protein